MHIRIIRFIYFALLFILILYTPVPFGSVLPDSILFIECASAILLLLSLYLYIKRPQEHLSSLKIKFIYPVIGLALLSIIQIIPLPSSLIHTITPHTTAIKQLAWTPYLQNILSWLKENSHANFTIDSIFPDNCLSLYPYASWYKLLFLLAMGMIFYSIVLAISTKREIRCVLAIIILSGLLQSFLYLIAYLKGHSLLDQLYGYQQEKIRATFINRNHYAAYLNMILPVLASWIFYHSRRHHRTRGTSLSKAISFIQSKKGIVSYMIIAFVLMSVGLVLSLSRAGIACCLFSFALLIYLISTRMGSMKAMTIIIIVFIIIVSMIYWIGYDPLIYRLKLIPLELEAKVGRLNLWKDASATIKDYPLAGVGLSNFSHIFLRYKSFSDARYIYAHNDYLQLAIELGIPGLLLLILALYYFYRQILTFPWQPHSRTKILILGLLAGIFAILMHSFFDFPLQVPANALLFAVLCALLFAFKKLETQSRELALPANNTSHHNPLSNHSYSYVIGAIIIITVPVYVIIACAFADNEMKSRTQESKKEFIISGLAEKLHIRSADYYYFLGQHSNKNNHTYQNLQTAFPADEKRKAFLYLAASLSNPLDYLSRYQLALLLWKESYPGEAVLQLLKDASFIYPMNDKLLLTLAWYYSIKSQLPESLTYFKKAAALNNDNLPFIYEKLKFFDRKNLDLVTPANFISMMYLAQFHIQQKDMSSAAKILGKAFKLGETQQKLEVIKQLIKINEADRAFKFLEQIENQTANEPDYHWLKAQYYIQKGSSKEFINEIDTALKMASMRYPPGSEEMNTFILEIAHTFLVLNMTNTAKIYYSKILDDDPYNPQANSEMANCYYNEGDLHNALSYAFNSEENQSMREFIIALFKQALKENKQEEIHAVINYFKSRSDTDAWAYLAIGLQEKNRRNYSEAINNIDTAVKLDPANTAFLHEAGMLYSVMQDEQTAISYYEKLLALQSYNIQAASELYILYIKTERLEDAKSLCLRLAYSKIKIEECSENI